MIDNDDLFEAVSDSRRRQLLVELVAHNPQRVPELSGSTRELAEADEELLRQHLSSSRDIPGVNEELLRLHYVHLPKLADHGFVEWDRDARVVTKGPRFDEIKSLLELLIDHRDDGQITGPTVPLRR